MKILIVGLGSIGTRHLNILREYFDHDIAVFRSGKSGACNIAGLQEFSTWNEVEAYQPEVAFITNPTHLHIDTAMNCAKLGMHLFIEKPLSNTLDGLSELRELCEQKSLTCYIAYCLRFHPVVKKINELLDGKSILHSRVTCTSYLPDWRKGHDSRNTYSAKADLGGGVLLDLSHEFDYISHLFGAIRKIEGNFGKLSNVTEDAEDYADVVLKTENNIVVNLHLDILSRKNERQIKVDFEGGYLLGDLIANRLEYSYSGESEKYEFDLGRNDYLKDQTDYFFKQIGNVDIMNNISESSQLLGQILEFKNGQ